MSDFKIKLDTIVDTTSFRASIKNLEKATPPVKIKTSVDSKEMRSVFSGPLSQEIKKTRDTLRGLTAEGLLSGETFKGLSTQVDEVERSMDKGNITFNEGVKRLNNITESAKGASSGFKGMVGDLSSIIGKFTLWYLVAGAVTGVIGLLKSMVSSVVELDAAMVDLNKVFDGTQEQLDAVADRAYKSASALATTGTEVLKSITNFKRMGYSIEEAGDLGELAIVMTNIAEDINSAGEAANILGSIMKGLGVDSSYALSILDRLNEVSNNNAISFDDLADMLQRSAATMKILGNNVDETIGMLTAGFEVLQNEKVAKGIQTIGLRIAGLNEDMSVAEGLSNDVSKALMKYADISVWDEQSGQLKSTYQVLSEVAEKWGEIGEMGGAQEALLNTLAGKERADVASAVISNWQAVKDAMEDAANSEGSALKENERFIDSIDGRVTNLKNTLEDIGRQVISSDLVKTIVNIANALAQVVGYILKWVKLALTISGVGLVFKQVGRIIENVGKWFEWLGEVISAVGDFFKPVIDGLDAILEWWSDVALGGWIVDLLNPSAKLDKQYKDIAETFEEAKKQVSEYDKAMNRLRRNLTNQLTATEENLAALKEQNDELKKQKEIQDKLIETQKAQMALEEARRKRTTMFRVGKGFVQTEDTAAVQEAQDNLQESIDSLADMKYDYALERTETFVTKLKEVITDGDIIQGWESLFNKFGDLLDTEFASYISSAKDFIDEFNATMEEQGVNVSVESARSSQRSAIKKQVDELTELLNSTEDKDEKMALKAEIAALQSQYNAISQNANGTTNFGGGLTWVGERGPEIVKLPRGSEILDNKRSISLKSMVDSGVIGTNKNGMVINLNGNLEFPNIENGGDAKSFIDEIINIGRNSIPRFV